jgi:uncharacterized protein
MTASADHPPARLVACWTALGVALILFSLVFAYPVLGFWRQLAGTAVVLTALSAPYLHSVFQPRAVLRWGYLVPAVVLGMVSAAMLYGVFVAGKAVLVWLHAGTGDAIRAVYTLDQTVSGWRVAMLLLLVIGPAEEIFWRGYIQRRLTEAYGWRGVAIAAGAYTAAHLSAANPVLILAAAVCGTFWGIQYYYSKNLLLNIVSHALWTTTAFVWLPFA